MQSHTATRFRQWATRQLREYIVKGFVLDDERLKNPDLPFDYFEELTRRIQDIRTSGKRFYQKITDIYATSVEELLENTQTIQLVNGLKQSSALSGKDFTIEMETGTGKTYVYLRSIFELNQKYGFTKFIIVVPSVAIKEGVYKSLQITKANDYDSFTAQY